MTPKRLTDLIVKADRETISGRSKTAKLAKQLLKLEPAPRKMEAVLVNALQASLQRAERWAKLGFA